MALPATGRLRKFPHPFRNMLAILSDVDLTSKAAFEGMHKFLNTRADCGRLGEGVGLDVGDTFWMGSVSGIDAGAAPEAGNHRSWRYWWTDTKREIYADAMRRYLAAGWIDVPHTFFDYRKDPRGYSRARAEAVVAEWARIGFTPCVWVDHARNPGNIATYRRGSLAAEARRGEQQITIADRVDATATGTAPGDTIVLGIGGPRVEIASSAPSGAGALTLGLTGTLVDALPAGTAISFHPARKPVEGAVRGSPYRSIDLALGAGIRAFWTKLPRAVDEATSEGRLGMETTLVPQTLPDGTRVWGLMRYYETGQTNNTWLGACLHRVLFGDALTGGAAMRPDTYMIVSTHLGYGDGDGVCDDQYTIAEDVRALNEGEWFNAQTVRALRALAAEQQEGRVLVTRTSRLVRYNLVHDMLAKHAGSGRGFEVLRTGAGDRIVVHAVHDDLFGATTPTVEDVRGITF